MGMNIYQISNTANELHFGSTTTETTPDIVYPESNLKML